MPAWFVHIKSEAFRSTDVGSDSEHVGLFSLWPDEHEDLRLDFSFVARVTKDFVHVIIKEGDLVAVEQTEPLTKEYLARLSHRQGFILRCFVAIFRYIRKELPPDDFMSGRVQETGEVGHIIAPIPPAFLGEVWERFNA